MNVGGFNIDIQAIIGIAKMLLFRILRIVPDFMRSLPTWVRAIGMGIAFILLIALIYWAYKNREAWRLVSYN